MSAEGAANLLATKAREAGPLSAPRYRVVVVESDLRTTIRDVDSLAEAKVYADDAASEGDGDPPIAEVFDPEFALVHVGRHYASR